MPIEPGNFKEDTDAKIKTKTAGLKVVAAIPCFNTEEAIGEVVAKTRKYVAQVIVVNDGSIDSTAEKAKASGATVINHVKNQGYGVTIKSCFEGAKAHGADVLVILDGDGQHDPADIPSVLAPILSGEADLVIGSRFLDHRNNMPRYRKFGIKVITFLFNFGSKTKVSDSASGFRAYRRKLLEMFSLAGKGMSVSIEILEQARKKGAIIKEVPISCRYFHSSPSLGAIRLGLSIALPVVKIRLKNRFFTKKKDNG